MGFANNVIPLTDINFRNFAYAVAANPSSIWPVKKEYHYKFLQTLYHLGLVSLPIVRKCANALQEIPTKNRRDTT